MSNNADVVIYLDGVVFHVYKNDMKVVREKKWCDITNRGELRIRTRFACVLSEERD